MCGFLSTLLNQSAACDFISSICSLPEQNTMYLPSGFVICLAKTSVRPSACSSARFSCSRSFSFSDTSPGFDKPSIRFFSCSSSFLYEYMAMTYLGSGSISLTIASPSVISEAMLPSKSSSAILRWLSR